MTVLYKLASGQLSKQSHYDFGLRALKAVLVMAGELKRGSPDLSEVSFLNTLPLLLLLFLFFYFLPHSPHVTFLPFFLTGLPEANLNSFKKHYL